ncbi:MAG: hypothetical protein C0404_06835 [Verrucomicrobia bacterium]|nr:hypothetical protein [Verrucomicrobiota bacterium]
MRVNAVEQIADDVLLRRYVDEGDRAALGELFVRYADLAYSTAMRVCRNSADADDAVQGAFLQVMEKAANFRGGGPHALKVWIISIVIGVAKHGIRSAVRRRDREHLVVQDEELLAPADMARQELEHQRLSAAVIEALGELPENYRMAIWLRHYQGLPARDVAATMGVNEKKLDNDLYHGMQKLRAALEKQRVPISAAGIVALLPGLLAERAPDPLVQLLRKLAADHVVEAGVGAAPAGVASLKIAAAAAAFAVAGIVAWFVTQPRQDTKTETTGPASIVQSPAAVSTNESDRMDYHWDFNSGTLPAELKVLNGRLGYMPHGGQDGSGCVYTEEVLTEIMVDVPLCAFPVAVSMEGAAVVGETYQGGQIIKTVAPMTNAARICGIRDYDINKKMWRKYADYHAGEWTARYLDDKICDMEVGRIDEKGRLVIAIVGKFRIDNLRIYSLAKTDLPEVNAFLLAFEKIPPAARRGSVPLPGIEPGRHDKLARVEFFSGGRGLTRDNLLRLPSLRE